MWSWWSSIDSVNRFNIWMQISIVVFGILTAAATALSIAASKRSATLQDAEASRLQDRLRATENSAEAIRKEAEALRNELSESALTQSELGKVENLATQIRIGVGKRSGLEKLIELKERSPNEVVRERAKERFESIAEDYESAVKKEFMEASNATALQVLEWFNLQDLRKEPSLFQD